MSGIAGLWCWDGEPDAACTVSRMLGAIAHRARGERGVWSRSSIALGHVGPRSAGTAVVEPATSSLTGHRIAIVFDGRLDNREEIARAIVDAGDPRPERSDADVALRACSLWGADAPRRFLGDFAFAFWDDRRRMLICARDVLGIRPF
jgi:asparagine synthase (glutamine-hydrolysing)